MTALRHRACGGVDFVLAMTGFTGLRRHSKLQLAEVNGLFHFKPVTSAIRSSP